MGIRYLIIVTNKGPKGSWWRKFVDNYFIVSEKDADNYEVKCLSNQWSENCSNVGEGKIIPKHYCEVREPEKIGTEKGSN
jgi:hypothetical protein